MSRSSAYRAKAVPIDLGRSATKLLKRRGYRREPCGTPAPLDCQADVVFLPESKLCFL